MKTKVGDMGSAYSVTFESEEIPNLVRDIIETFLTIKEKLGKSDAEAGDIAMVEFYEAIAIATPSNELLKAWKLLKDK